MKKYLFKPRGRSAILVDEKDLEDMIVKYGAGTKPKPKKTSKKKLIKEDKNGN